MLCLVCKRKCRLESAGAREGLRQGRRRVILCVMPSFLDKPTEREERERFRYVRKTRRSITLKTSTTQETFFARILRFILPWQLRAYPGKGPGMAELLGYKYAIRTVWHWNHGGKVPLHALDVLKTYITCKAEEGLAIAAEIQAEIDRQKATPRKLAGCCAVDPLTGRSKRSKIAPHKGVAPREHNKEEPQEPKTET